MSLGLWDFEEFCEEKKWGKRLKKLEVKFST